MRYLSTLMVIIFTPVLVNSGSSNSVGYFVDEFTVRCTPMKTAGLINISCRLPLVMDRCHTQEADFMHISSIKMQSVCNLAVQVWSIPDFTNEKCRVFQACVLLYLFLWWKSLHSFRRKKKEYPHKKYYYCVRICLSYSLCACMHPY